MLNSTEMSDHARRAEEFADIVRAMTSDEETDVRHQAWGSVTVSSRVVDAPEFVVNFTGPGLAVHLGMIRVLVPGDTEPTDMDLLTAFTLIRKHYQHAEPRRLGDAR